MGSHGRKNPTDPNLGLRIELARRRAGMTQQDVAKQLGLTSGAVSHWETGRFEPPRDKMKPLALLLDVPLGWLEGEHLSDEAIRFEGTLLRLLLQSTDETFSALIEELNGIDSPESLLAVLRARAPTPSR